MADPLSISVVVATFNSVRWLEEQLISILGQTRPPDEIVITDDGSTDGTLDLAQSLTSGTSVDVRILSGRAGGILANFERGLRASTGEILVLSDHDDVWLEDKLSVTEEWFSQAEDRVLFFSDATLIDASGDPTGTTLWEGYRFSRTDQERWNAGHEWEILARKPVVTGATAAFRRELVDDLFPIPAGTWHDEWLAMIAPLRGRTGCTSRPLVRYRVHGGNAVGVPVMTVRTRMKNLLDGVAPNPHELARWQELGARVGRVGRADDVVVRRKIAFSRTRQNIALSRVRRAPSVARLAAGGGYGEFADGWRTALSDLLKPWRATD